MGDDGLYKRGKIWWIRTDPLTGKESSTKCRDKVAAIAVRTDRERRAADPHYAAEAAPAQTLGEWVTLVIEQKKRMRAAATAEFYESKLGHIVRIFGAQSTIGVLTPRGFDRYVQQRTEEGTRPTTILKEIGCAKVVASEAERHGAFRGNTKLFKPSDLSNDYEPGERFLLPDELPKLLAELSDKRGAHVMIAIATGTRFSESFRVTSGGIRHMPASESEPERYLVFVPGTKTKKSKDTVPVAGPLHPLLLAGMPFLPLPAWSNMTRDLERACARAGIPKVTSNDLRRTTASWLTEAGVPDSMVSRLLRHVDERMVRRVYGRSRPEKLALALAAQLSVTAEARQLPAGDRESATKDQQMPQETDSDEEKARGLKILVSAVQFRPGTQEENSGSREIEGGSEHPAECQDVSEGDANSQNLPDKSATISGAPPAFGRALAGVVPGELDRKQRGHSKHQKTAGYRGVTWNKRGKTWQASIGGGEKKPDGRRRQLHLGFFANPIDAAKAYDAAARAAFGDSARCNFPVARPPKKTSPYIARKRTGGAR